MSSSSLACVVGIDVDAKIVEIFGSEPDSSAALSHCRAMNRSRFPVYEPLGAVPGGEWLEKATEQ